MIGERTITLYPKTAAQAIHSCYHCFNTICEDRNVPSGNPFILQSAVAYRTIQEQNAYSASDYFWRKYYSDLAMGFSKPIPTHFKHCKQSEDSKNVTTVQQYNISKESREIFGKNENGHIWRPFSTSPEIRDSCLPGENKFQGKIQSASQESYLSIIPSINKLDHSTSSVFVPVKKKSHFCPKCPSAFHSSLQLSTHMRGHIGSKPFACDYPNCLKSFARNEELTRHRRIHSGYKPHHCNSCGKSFGRKDHLSKHLKTHLQVSEKKVYICRVSGCGHRYTRSDALTRHKSNAHAIHKSKTAKEGNKGD